MEQSRVNWKVAAGLAIGSPESALEMRRSWPVAPTQYSPALALTTVADNHIMDHILL